MANETSLGGIAWTVDADTSPAVNSTTQFGKTVDNVENKLKGLDTQTTKTAKSVKTGMATMGRSAGQAGIQLQQFIGQIQGGQNAMLALSQQSADLGFVLGAPLLGAVVGISASIAGLLLPELFKSTSALEDIEKATENVRAAMTLSADGVAKYSEQMAMLKNISQELLKVKLATLIADQQAAMEAAVTGLQDALDDSRGSFTTWSGQVRKVFGDTSREAVDAMRALSGATKDLRFGVTAERISAVEAALTQATAAGINNSAVGREIARTMTELIAKYKIGELTIEQFNKALEDTNIVAEGANRTLEKYQSIADSLSTRVFKLRSESLEREKALTLEQAAQDGVTQSVIDSIAASYDKMIANAREAESEREKAKAIRETEAARRKEEAARRKILAEEQANRRASAKRAKSIKEGVDFASGIVERGLGESPEVMRLRKEQEKLDELREQGKISEQLYQAALTQIKEDGERERARSTMMALGSMSSAFDSIATIFKDAQGETSTAYKAMFAISKGFAIAQAGVNTALAVSEAMKLPWPANLPLMAQAAASGAALLGQISSAKYAGREHGGSMMANVPYEVGEKNKPELLMIPGNNGKMFSNAEVKGMMGGGGAQLNQTINNYAAADGYQVRTRGDGVNQQQVIDIIRSESGNPNSHMRRNLTSGTNVQNRIRGGRN